jgi:putative tricarboxylic transport membrane protein
LTKLNSSPSWKKTVEERKWTNTFLSGNAFEEAIKKDISETEVILKSLGLA